MVLELSQGMDKTVNFSCFKDLLLQTCGHSFEKEREQTLATALRRRMSALNIQRHDRYHARLMHDRDELLRLIELLTVNETYFFREPEHLSLIIDMFPELMAGRGQKPIRILSAGCSTGEEPYSIAMLLRERFGASSEQLFDITGVDINSSVIASAQQGIYGESSFRGFNNAMLERYFEPCGSGQFRIDKAIRRQVAFEVVNLLEAAYPPRMQLPDIVLYRNVSIYFPGQVQQQIFRKLSELLGEGGCLFVGAAETMHHDLGILSLVKRDSLFFYRKAPPVVSPERRRQSGFDSPFEQVRSTAQPTDKITATNFEVNLILRQEERYAERSTNRTSLDKSLHIDEHYELALDLARNNRLEESLALLDEIIARNASFSKAYTLKANLLLNASRFDEVVATCNLALDQNLLCPEVYLMLGIGARQQGDDDGALKRFRESLYLDVNCWLAHFYSAETHYGRGDSKRAHSSYAATTRILDKLAASGTDQSLLPLSFNVGQFAAICKHKLSLIAGKKS